jgi:hypothetical protein
MPIHVRVDRATRVVEVVLQPPLAGGVAEELARQVAVASQAIARCGVLLDLREVGWALDMGALWHVAASLASSAPRAIDRVALLASTERMSNARFFELAAHNRGFNARAFDDHARALAWLADRAWEVPAASRSC